MQVKERRRWWFIWLWIWLLSACGGPATFSGTPAAELHVSTSVPSLRFIDPPTSLCREATQLRLQPIFESAWPEGTVANWEMRPAAKTHVVAEGRWHPKERDLFIAFPEGAPLKPGEYVLTLHVNGTQVAEHAFTVQATAPRLTAVSLALTPEGPTSTVLQTPLRLFYVRYAYEGVCPGTPLWVVVTREGERLVHQNLVLQADQGTGEVAFYLDAGAPFEAGAYQATLTLGGEEERTLTFRVKEPLDPTPQATATPIPPAPICEPPFAAMGLTPEGTPYRPLERFEWYTQAVYVGAACRHVPARTRWVARWYRNGEEVRVYRGRWTGGDAGLLWDSLTGTEEAPFLPPGVYTTTLSLGALPPLEVGFNVAPYVPSE
ncbi:MAG: hypothetical protein ACP5HM_03615 [Anaerolineae bacterium]